MKHGYQKGHKEMAGAYGLDKAYKPQIKSLPKGVRKTGKQTGEKK